MKLPPSVGRYEVLDRLGHGGMGTVYLGRDPRIGRPVAIKVMHVSDDEMRDRFLQEAQSAGSLKHRNIVTIYDFGEHDGQPFLVMEFVEGVTLAEQIKSRAPLTVPRKLELIEELAAGLEYAHNKGIVHRDVKPANVMVDHDNVLKILDFGIARMGESGMTMAGVLVGTPNYMSPEQIEGRAVDRRSDIFAVGVVSYELLTYQQAFAGDTVHSVMNGIMRGVPAALDQRCPGIDPAIVAIVNRAIEKDPSRRYQTLAAMAADVAKVRTGLGKEDLSRDRSDATTIVARTPTPRTPRSGTDRNMLSKRRAELIESHLQTAREAFERADYDGAVKACEHAALLDPDEPRVVALIGRALEALDAQRIGVLLKDARHCMDLQEITRAAEFVSRALEVDPRSTDALDLQARIKKIEWAREQEARKRQAAEEALGRARAQLSSGQFEAAIRSAREALLQDPTSEEAREISQTANDKIEERRQVEQLAASERRAREEEARRRHAEQLNHALALGARALESGDFDAAARLADEAIALEAASTDAAALKKRAVEGAERRQRALAEEAERRRTAASEEAGRRAGAERLARQQRIDGESALARQEIAASLFGQALSRLQALVQADGEAPGIQKLIDEARTGQAAAEAQAKRDREIAAFLEEAQRAIDQNDFTRAAARIDSALALDPAHQRATDAREALHTLVDDARRLDQERARRQAEGARLEREQTLRGRIAEAKGHLDRKQAQRAIRILEELRQRVADSDQDIRSEIETLLGMARQRVQLDVLLTDAEESLKRRTPDAALHKVAQALVLDPKSPEALELKAKIRAVIDEESRKEHEELEKRRRAAQQQEALERGQRVAALHKRAKATASHQAAIAILKEALELDPEDKKCRDLMSARQGDLVASIEQLIVGGQFDRAAEAVDEAESLFAGAAGLATLRQRVESGRTASAVSARSASDAGTAVVGTEGSATSTQLSWSPKTTYAWKGSLIAGVAAVAVLGIGVTLYVNRASSTAPAEPSTPTAAATTSIQVPAAAPAAPAPPVAAVVDAGKTPPVDTDTIVRNARALMQQKDFSGAARLVADGLTRAPADAALRRTGQDVVAGAAAAADDARQTAERAGASDRQQYREAATLVQAGARSRAGNRIEQAVTDYLAAAKSFSDAGVVVASVPTSIPVAPPAPVAPPPAAVAPAPTTVLSTIATTSVATTSILPPSIDAATVNRLLTTFASAQKTLDFNAVQRLYPGASPLMRQRIDALKREYSACDYTYTNLRIVSAVGNEAQVRADQTESCKPKTAQPAINLTTAQQIRLTKDGAGNWSLAEVLGSQ